MRQRTSWLLVIMLWAGIVGAQAENPTVTPINYGAVVNDTLTDELFYDWWLLDGSIGDELIVTMSASDGLAPLIGLLSPTRDLIARSDDGEPNATTELRTTLEANGEYVIVATRVGNADGETFGAYTLSVSRDVPPPPERVDPYREVEFTCNAGSAVNLLTLEIQEDADQTRFIGVSVYGLDGLVPVLRTTLEFDFEPYSDQFCIDPVGSEGVGNGEGDTLRLPNDDAPHTYVGGDVARTNFADAPDFGILQLNVGAMTDRDGGRFVVVIDGFTVGPDGDRDLFQMGLGPLLREGTLDVYMISDKTTRLDPALERVDADYETLRLCDDAAIPPCDDVPPIDGFATFASEYERTVTAGRFDAGLRLQPGAPDVLRVLAGSFDGRTSGGYTLVIIGEYAP